MQLKLQICPGLGLKPSTRPSPTLIATQAAEMAKTFKPAELPAQHRASPHEHLRKLNHVRIAVGGCDVAARVAQAGPYQARQGVGGTSPCMLPLLPCQSSPAVYPVCISAGQAHGTAHGQLLSLSMLLSCCRRASCRTARTASCSACGQWSTSAAPTGNAPRAMPAPA